jgi:hypothetical protein
MNATIGEIDKSTQHTVFRTFPMRITIRMEGVFDIFILFFFFPSTSARTSDLTVVRWLVDGGLTTDRSA